MYATPPKAAGPPPALLAWGYWVIAGTSIGLPYPCPCDREQHWEAPVDRWCPCVGRRDFGAMERWCCALRARGVTDAQLAAARAAAA